MQTPRLTRDGSYRSCLSPLVSRSSHRPRIVLGLACLGSQGTRRRRDLCTNICMAFGRDPYGTRSALMLLFVLRTCPCLEESGGTFAYHVFVRSTSYESMHDGIQYWVFVHGRADVACLSYNMVTKHLKASFRQQPTLTHGQQQTGAASPQGAWAATSDEHLAVGW